MTTNLDPARPAATGPRQPSHSRAAALLAAAAPLAAAALLAATPLAVAAPTVTPAATPRAAAVVPSGGDPCATTLTTGGHDALKYPVCAGD
jgi:uncharacterized membrane protein YoaK (UPF0700 family)